ncbi:MAG: 6-phosphogluconolactonase [Leptolyngbyaceae cyanobacterium]
MSPTAVRTFDVDALHVQVYSDPDRLAQAAASQVIDHLQYTLQQQATATVVFATGRSQLGLLRQLCQDTTVDWSRVIGLHLDEFLGLNRDHPASFGYYLDQHLARWLPLRSFHYLRGDAPKPMAECDRYTGLLTQTPIDLCLLGVGNNGHLAFNDPAVADFNDPLWVKLVRLDDINRQQQLASDHFSELRDVPTYGITLTLSAIVNARHTVCCLFGAHKHDILTTLLSAPPSSACPASILRLKGAKNYLFTDTCTLVPS